MEKQYLNTAQVAKLLSLSIFTIKKYVRERTIPAYKVGRRWLFEKNEIIQWIESQKQPMK